jgi:hypothetical protein
VGGIIFVLVLSGIIAAISMIGESERQAKLTPTQRLEQRLAAVHGPRNRQMVCPHCQHKGEVHTKPVTAKKGVSGAKATGALLTAGVSLLATGLSRKENLTEAHCANCSATWRF